MKWDQYGYYGKNSEYGNDHMHSCIWLENVLIIDSYNNFIEMKIIKFTMGDIIINRGYL